MGCIIIIIRRRRRIVLLFLPSDPTDGMALYSLNSRASTASTSSASDMSIVFSRCEQRCHCRRRTLWFNKELLCRVWLGPHCSVRIRSISCPADRNVQTSLWLFALTLSYFKTKTIYPSIVCPRHPPPKSVFNCKCCRYLCLFSVQQRDDAKTVISNASPVCATFVFANAYVIRVGEDWIYTVLRRLIHAM